MESTAKGRTTTINNDLRSSTSHRMTIRWCGMKNQMHYNSSHFTQPTSGTPAQPININEQMPHSYKEF
eukprot:1997046-Amphidinium_carterae.1